MSFLRRASVVFALAAAVMGSVVAGATAAPSAAAPATAAPSPLETTIIAETDYCYYADGGAFNRTSPDTRTRFVFQNDGNLVVYVDGQAKWASWTNGKGAAWFCFQADGNLVIYNGARTVALWESNTDGYPNRVVAIQNDGNVVAYRDAGLWQVLWHTNTYRR